MHTTPTAPPPRTIYLGAPERKWEPTGNYTHEGKPLFASREWKPGEKAEYVRTILHRDLYLGR